MIRVLLAKPGIDGHDVGVKVVARALRDAGMEVIYSGLRTTIAETVRMSVQEDVDVIGVSNLSGQHVTMMAELKNGLDKAGFDDVLVVAGGTLLREDIAALKQLGIEGCFPPGTDTGEIINFIREHAPVREGAASAESA
jgi:methylmalonyl-CoA mutase C-terminal domain/subunit